MKKNDCDFAGHMTCGDAAEATAGGAFLTVSADNAVNAAA